MPSRKNVKDEKETGTKSGRETRPETGVRRCGVVRCEFKRCRQKRQHRAAVSQWSANLVASGDARLGGADELRKSVWRVMGRMVCQLGGSLKYRVYSHPVDMRNRSGDWRASSIPR